MVGRTKKRAPPKERGSPIQEVPPRRRRESPSPRRSPRRTNSPQAGNEGDSGNINVSPNDQSLDSQANLDVSSDLVEPGLVADHFENDNENVTEQLAEPDFDSLDPYSVLGIPKQTTTCQIKKTFHKLSKQYHPDRLPPNQQDVHTTFTLILNAYEILMDTDKRREHDLTLLAYHTVINNAANNVDDEDSLNQVDPEDKLHSSSASNSKTSMANSSGHPNDAGKKTAAKDAASSTFFRPNQMILLRIQVMIVKMVHVQHHQHNLVGKF
jgi:hypothetical protein